MHQLRTALEPAAFLATPAFTIPCSFGGFRYANSERYPTSVNGSFHL